MNDGDEGSPRRSGQLQVSIQEVKPRWFDDNGKANITARIDAVDILHLTPKGVYWEYGGSWGRVGRHDGYYSTTINGIHWWPEWPENKVSKPLLAPELQSMKAFEMVPVESKRGKVVIDPPVEPNHVSLRFTDGGNGSSIVSCAITLKK
jgi:hypothetical protein